HHSPPRRGLFVRRDRRDREAPARHGEDLHPPGQTGIEAISGGSPMKLRRLGCLPRTITELKLRRLGCLPCTLTGSRARKAVFRRCKPRGFTHGFAGKIRAKIAETSPVPNP